MNKEQYDKLVALIKKGAKIDGRYINDDGDRCVVGDMAMEVGFSEECLKKAGYGSVTMPTPEHQEPVRCITQRVMEGFGLSYEQLKLLQVVNDSYHYGQTGKRRESLIAKASEFLKQEPKQESKE